MILPNKKIIFVHVPKTGGTSIEHYLWYNLGLDKQYGKFFFYKKFFPSEHAHDPIQRYKYDDNYFKFGFVRNPYSRLISHYAFHQEYWSHRKYRSANDLLLKLRDFSHQRNPHPNTNKHYYTQYYFLNKDMDFIGRYENLHKDFSKALRKAGLGVHSLDAHEFKTSGEYKEECKEMIAANLEEITNIYRIDFEKFNYEQYNLNFI